MSKNDEQYRAGFEAWADGEDRPGPGWFERDEAGEYVDYGAAMAWSAYVTAKREASTEPSGLVEDLRAALRSVNAVAIERGDEYGACDQIDNSGTPYQSQWFADLVADQPKQGTATATEPSTSGFCLTDRGLSFPDGSHITPEGEVTGPLAHAMAGQIGQVVARLKAGAGALPDEAADWRERAAQACYAERVAAHETKAAEDTAYNAAIEACMNAIRNLDAGAGALRDEAKDAERYRWLRDKSEPGICAFYLSVGQAFKGVKFARETVDEAIDSAIATSTAPVDPRLVTGTGDGAVPRGVLLPAASANKGPANAS